VYAIIEPANPVSVHITVVLNKNFIDFSALSWCIADLAYCMQNDACLFFTASCKPSGRYDQAGFPLGQTLFSADSRHANAHGRMLRAGDHPTIGHCGSAPQPIGKKALPDIE
jgi:hypothetical protein